MSKDAPQGQNYGKLPGTLRRRPNVELRPRGEYLTPAEVNNIASAAQLSSRYPLRDWLMVVMAYKHGLRASELCDMQWEQIMLSEARIKINRAKMGKPSMHPLDGDVLRALRKHQRSQELGQKFVFTTERGTPMSTDTFHNLVRRAGKAAKMPFDVHPHMLRHACGYALVNAGYDTRLIQDYLGHRSIQSVVQYTALSEQRFKECTKILALGRKHKAKDDPFKQLPNAEDFKGFGKLIV